MKKLFILCLLVSGFVFFSTAQTVGVGSTAFTPQSTLHVYNAAGGNLFQLSNSTAATTGFQINMNSGVNFSLINRQNGYMSFYTNNSEYMRLTNAGFVGMGTTVPRNKLDVRGNVSINDGGSMGLQSNLTVRQTVNPFNGTNIILANLSADFRQNTVANSNGAGIKFTVGNADSYTGTAAIVAERTSSWSAGKLHFAVNNAGASGKTEIPIYMTIDGPSGGNVGIGTTTPSYKLHVIGRIKTDGINETSDRRLKKNIVPISGAMDKIEQLQGVNYEWKDPQMEKGTQLGLIAQDVEEVLPYIVNTDNEGYKSLQYSVLVALLIEGSKEQQSEIEELKFQISEMQKQIEALKTIVDYQNDSNLKSEKER